MKKITVVLIGIATAGLVFTGCSQHASADTAANRKAEEIEVIDEGAQVLAAAGNIELTGVLQVDGMSETSEEETVSAVKENQNTVLVENGGTLNMTGGELAKTGDTTSADESEFYGVNAAFVTTAGSESSIVDSVISSSSKGGNAIFVTGKGALVDVKEVQINTSGDSSRGLAVSYAGVIKAENVDVTTSGTHSAPISAEYGGGTITVLGGTVASSGDGSPCIFSAGTITVENLEGTALGSQMMIVDGANSINMKNSNLSGAGENGIIMYRDTVNDTSEETAKIKVTDSTLTSTGDGAMLYVTNTDASIKLEKTELKNKGDKLIKVSGNSTNNWGAAGSNGGNLKLTAVAQKLDGNITCDEISTLSINLTEKSTLDGQVNKEAKGKNVEITLDKDSEWELTGDSYITSLMNEDTKCSNIDSNGYTIYYDSTSSGNSWLAGKTITLSGGGKLAPK